MRNFINTVYLAIAAACQSPPSALPLRHTPTPQEGEDNGI